MNDLLKDIKTKKEEIRKSPFAFLQRVNAIRNNCDSAYFNKIIFYLLDNKDLFLGYEEILNSMIINAGLYQYADESIGSIKDSLCISLHKPSSLNDVTFHKEQSEVLQYILNGQNVAVSAPTSFGKSKIIDAVLAYKKFTNIVIIVPTIALLDETRRRLSFLSDSYKIISQLSQKTSDKNIFVFTAERFNKYENLPRIDFFVIDEFYKLSSGGIDGGDKRYIALNQALYKLIKHGAQAYLLGPNINNVVTGQFKNIHFFSTDFATVATEIIRKNIVKDEEKQKELLKICTECIKNKEQALIFCKSPSSANAIASFLLASLQGQESRQSNVVSDLFSSMYHKDWIVSKAAKHSIAIHHGRIPRSLAQLSVNLFNDNIIKFLICTSTLIEGVNTTAKKVIIYDNKINKKPIDFFTFNNIKGRSGRMFKHFIGTAYIFAEQPQNTLPTVDIPAMSQSANTPPSILLHISDEELTDNSKQKLEKIKKQTVLPVQLIKKNGSVEPEIQIQFAEEIQKNLSHYSGILSWEGFPLSSQLYDTCELLWKHFVSIENRGMVYGIANGRQLAKKLTNLSKRPTFKEKIYNEMHQGQYSAGDVTEAIDKIMIFEKHWCEYTLGLYLSTMDSIQKYIFQKNNIKYGSYASYISAVECLFSNPLFQALEEFGLPYQISEKISYIFKGLNDIDIAISKIKKLDVTQCNLSKIEQYIVKKTLHGL